MSEHADALRLADEAEEKAHDLRTSVMYVASDGDAIQAESEANQWDALASAIRELHEENQEWERNFDACYKDSEFFQAEVARLREELERQREWLDAHRAAVEEASKIIEEKNTELARLQEQAGEIERLRQGLELRCLSPRRQYTGREGLGD